MSQNTLFWQTRLHARLHDPIEKPLVLMRDPSGHEGGTSRILHDAVLPEGIPRTARDAVKRADWWASAADRPQFPRQSSDGRYASWTQVRFHEQPVIMHPLTGEPLDLVKLTELPVEAVKSAAEAHLRKLLQPWLSEGDLTDPATLQRMALSLWRFGPEVDETESESRLGALWRVLPADTRVPDHSIWDHLDLVAAFSGAFVADPNGECALLTVALGPVQGFIAQARSTSDLWAGSHLLARMSWEAMRVVCERYGPEAVLFPSLRGVPQVDLWLIERFGFDQELFAGQDWREGPLTDGNPLFSATLPNRFTALVPACDAAEVAAEIQSAVRRWVTNACHEAWGMVLEEIDEDAEAGQHGHHQIDEQLAGFPEVHWSAVPWSQYVRPQDPARQTDLDIGGLQAACGAFSPSEASFSEMPAWRGWNVLSGSISADAEVRFYQPNPGVLYPVVRDLGDRALAAVKAGAGFRPLVQEGRRCSLTSEQEWLTTDPDQLALSPGQRTDTIWARIAERRPDWARQGEHLGAFGMLKRLWADLFQDELRQVLDADFPRFRVSTHTMAMVPAIEQLLDDPQRLRKAVKQLADQPQGGRVALPPRLAARVRRLPDETTRDLMFQLPGLLESDADAEDGGALSAALGLTGRQREGYYALLLMDGDRLGSWLAGDPERSISYLESFHPALQASLQRRFGNHEAMQRYLQMPRALSPGRHMALSSALNDFASVVVRLVVERAFNGRILYCGGDDLLAMLPVKDVLPLMQALRSAFVGERCDLALDQIDFARGFARRQAKGPGAGRIYRMMGARASASMGVVIAHHQAPLAGVLQQVRQAEQRAKQSGGRNAFSVTVAKRAGAPVTFTGRFDRQGGDGIAAGLGSDLGLLKAMQQALMDSDEASRRAIYHSLQWLRDMPDPALLSGSDRGGPGAGEQFAVQQLLEGLLTYQFERQRLALDSTPGLVSALASAAAARGSAAAIQEWLSALLSLAEFLAREARQA